MLHEYEQEKYFRLKHSHTLQRKNGMYKTVMLFEFSPKMRQMSQNIFLEEIYEYIFKVFSKGAYI